MYNWNGRYYQLSNQYIGGGKIPRRRRDSSEELGRLIAKVVLTSIEGGTEIEKRKAIENKDVSKAIAFAVSNEISKHIKREL